LTARIDLVEGAAGTSVQVAGRLDERAARELVDACSRRQGALTVDLRELVSADRFAVEALRGLRSAGARLVGASPYIATLLNGGPSHPAAGTDSKREDE
jgi:anti-anti-sigma regulatory factor